MKKPVQVKFTSIIQKFENMDAAYIPVEFDVEKTFGKKRLKAKIWFDDVLYRGLLAKYNGQYNLMMNKSIRAQVGKDAGDKVNIKIEEDLEERTVELPPVLFDFFNKEKDLKVVFDKMSYTHQREYVEWILSAKKKETLQNRLIKLKELLSQKDKMQKAV